MKPSVWSAGKVYSIHISLHHPYHYMAVAGQVADWKGRQWEEGCCSADSGPDTGPHSPHGLLRFPSTSREGYY